MNDKTFKFFSEWLDSLLKNGIPENTAALTFNLYEAFDKEHTWSAELGFCDCFDPDDIDWACYAELCEKVFVWDDDPEWEEALETAEKLVKKYLEEGSFSSKIKALHGVGVGFAEGDLDIIYINKESKAPCKDYPHYQPKQAESLIDNKVNDVINQIFNK